MPSNIDANSGLIYQVKRPEESRKYGVDFARVLPAGGGLAAIELLSAAGIGLVDEVDPLVVAALNVSGTVANINVSGGTDNEDYEVTIKCTDSGGDIVSDDVMIKVRKAGLV